MSFPFSVYLLALTGAWLTTFFTLPAWRAWCVRGGLVDDPGHRKLHKNPIPLAGGLAVMTGIALPLLLGALELKFQFLGAAAQPLAHGFSRRAIQLIAIVLGAAGMLGLGWWDDKYELRPAAKFAGQFLIASLVAAAGVRITLFVPNVAFSYLVTVLWILTVTNAFNFMDNMNGLCTGLGAISACYFGLIAAVDGQYLVGLMAFLICGALLGFLPHNFPKASAFLGDAGSHLVGYLLAVLGILPHFYSSTNPEVWAVFTPLLILAIPLIDIVWVVALRWHIGQPIYIGDNNHLSHQLVRRGLSPVRTVLIIWLMAAVLGGFAFI